MRKTWRIVPAWAAAVITAAPVWAAAPKALEPLGFLLGEWQAESGGKAGEASGGFTFAPSLQGRVVMRTNHAEYPAVQGRPAAQHDDLMVFYATESGELRADYFDNEGHVIRYVGAPAAGGELTLVSEVVSGAPRFRLSYQLGADGLLAGRFEIAPAGKPDSFAPYLAWTAHRRSAAK